MRALWLILAMSLANELSAGVSDEGPVSDGRRTKRDLPPIEAEPFATKAPQDDDPGGIAAMLTWGNFASAPTGAAVEAVARAHARDLRPKPR